MPLEIHDRGEQGGETGYHGRSFSSDARARGGQTLQLVLTSLTERFGRVPPHLCPHAIQLAWNVRLSRADRGALLDQWMARWPDTGWQMFPLKR